MNTELKNNMSSDIFQNHSKKLVAVVSFVVAFFIVSSVLNTREDSMTFTQRKIYDDLSSKSLEIKDINLLPTEDGFDVKVEIEGKPVGKYQLTADFYSHDFIKSKFVQLSELIPSPKNHWKEETSKDPKRRVYSFHMSFEELARAYRAELSNFRPSIKAKIDIAEKISIEVSSRLVEFKGYDVDEILSLNLPSNEMTAVALFDFMCLSDSCKVVTSK